MKKIAFFCIPAAGHTNPMLPVAAELVKRKNTVRFYSFDEFETKIRAAGAEFISCSSFLPELTKKEEAGLKSISATQMAVQDIRITRRMDSFLTEEFNTFCPDVVYTDAVCFWGKLSAWKHHIPMVVSVSTFAFNQLSAQYMKNTPKETADMVFGLPRVKKELKKLEPCGYHIKSALSLVQNDNRTDSIVYTSPEFQPYAESFSGHYAFVGPSVFTKKLPNKKKTRPLVYISMGTVMNDKRDFYLKCIAALKNENADVILSCGNAIDPKSFGALPDNVQIFSYVDQLNVLSGADVFITHCGMNSVSESLYMAVPMVLYPQTGEQKAVAKRVREIHAGILLKCGSAKALCAAVREILGNPAYAKAAAAYSADFRACAGAAGAADFIENAPHSPKGADIMGEINRRAGKLRALYWLFAVGAMLLFGFFVSRKFVWVIGLAAGILSSPINTAIQKRLYAFLIKSKL